MLQQYLLPHLPRNHFLHQHIKEEVVLLASSKGVVNIGSLLEWVFKGVMEQKGGYNREKNEEVEVSDSFTHYMDNLGEQNSRSFNGFDTPLYGLKSSFMRFLYSRK